MYKFNKLAVRLNNLIMSNIDVYTCFVTHAHNMDTHARNHKHSDKQVSVQMWDSQILTPVKHTINIIHSHKHINTLIKSHSLSLTITKHIWLLLPEYQRFLGN